MQKFKVILMAMAILLPASKLIAQPKSEKLDTLLQRIHREGKFDGAILVANKQGVVYKNGFGIATLKPATLNKFTTVFYIASLSKPFTSTLIMQLVQRGKIKLDNKLEDYLPHLKNESIRKVTIHQLLSHTSGIPDFIDGTTSEKNYTDQWFTQKLDSLKFDTASEKKFKYANSTYVLLAHIIEKVTGKSYAKNLKENILSPLKMHKSGSLVTGQKIKIIAEGHVARDSIMSIAPYLNPASFEGAGSIYSTVEDLYKFDQALYADKLLPAKYKDLMFTNQSEAPYGYGWFVRKLSVGKVVMHEGDIPGYTSLIFRAIEKNYFIIMLGNNQSHDKYKQEIVSRIIGVLDEENKD